MEIGRNRIGTALFALLVAGMSVSDASALARNTGIWKVLRAGHFVAPMDEFAHVRPIKGAILANGTKYRFWEYSAVDKENGHGISALLVFEQRAQQLSYLGRYSVDLDDFRGPVHPEIRGKTVFFPYHEIEILGVKQSLTISFENGPPPVLGPDGSIMFAQGL